MSTNHMDLTIITFQPGNSLENLAYFTLSLSFAQVSIHGYSAVCYTMHEVKTQIWLVNFQLHNQSMIEDTDPGIAHTWSCRRRRVSVEDDGTFSSSRLPKQPETSSTDSQWVTLTFDLAFRRAKPSAER